MKIDAEILINSMLECPSNAKIILNFGEFFTAPSSNGSLAFIGKCEKCGSIIGDADAWYEDSHICCECQESITSME
jgi:hypothetical protein